MNTFSLKYLNSNDGTPIKEFKLHFHSFVDNCLQDGGFISFNIEIVIPLELREEGVYVKVSTFFIVQYATPISVMYCEMCIAHKLFHFTLYIVRTHTFHCAICIVYDLFTD